MSSPCPAGRPPLRPPGRRNKRDPHIPRLEQSVALRGQREGKGFGRASVSANSGPHACKYASPPNATSLPATSPSSPRTPRCRPRPTLTSEPLGVVLGGAEWRLRPEASINHRVAGLEIRGGGRIQAALCGVGGEIKESLGIWILALGCPPQSLRPAGRGATGTAGAPCSHLQRWPHWTVWRQRGIEPGHSALHPPAAAR